MQPPILRGDRRPIYLHLDFSCATFLSTFFFIQPLHPPFLVVLRQLHSFRVREIRIQHDPASALRCPTYLPLLSALVESSRTFPSPWPSWTYTFIQFFERITPVQLCCPITHRLDFTFRLTTSSFKACERSFLEVSKHPQNANNKC